MHLISCGISQGHFIRYVFVRQFLDGCTPGKLNSLFADAGVELPTSPVVRTLVKVRADK